MKTTYKLAWAIIPLSVSINLYADQQIQDDLIVVGSACIGQDCVNGENFSFDTLRLKENNLRIKFQDTSSSGSFPTNDWQLTANDSANGGLNKFSIDDVDSGRTPFTIMAGAKNNSLFVASSGRIGVGTSTPVVPLHVVDGNTPAMRLEQDGSSGFSAQTWDVAGNETNFFIRDVTNGSKLPFKIKPGAPSNSVFIDVDGDIGLGTASPSAKLHINSLDTNSPLVPTMLIRNTDATSPTRLSLELEAQNTSAISFLRKTNGKNWWVHNYQDSINFDERESQGIEFSVDANGNGYFKGNITAGGTINGSSSRETKNNINLINGDNILKLIANLDIYSWSYIQDAGKIIHIGPMAEEFFETFSVGVDNKHISPTDTSGISLAAIKALMNKVESQNEKIEKLENSLIKLQQAKP
ncbi:tail fiber domain-containing protein [Shewanella sp. SG44-6]|uniref:tail fiber domain-containing protein n=1 Tax=Shewanella sp. SG44-6 TaxID=2760959 RepID=UPI0015FF84B8|nr:tail fiber domain-containing protein [Shewanella sp. SG44-6]MBB1391281.1 tail fiber domain-containing protein [Shewanella sp. SG44-6]